MKNRQQNEIDKLDYFIENSFSLINWDWLSNWAQWSYADDKIKYVEWSDLSVNPEYVYFQINWQWAKGFVTWKIEEKIRVNKLLKAKQRYDLFVAQINEDPWSVDTSELDHTIFKKELQLITKLRSESKREDWYPVYECLYTKPVEKKKTFLDKLLYKINTMRIKIDLYLMNR